MVSLRGLIMFAVLCGYVSLQAQDKSTQWSLVSGYEANYFGNNINFLLRYDKDDKHVIDGGVSYNLSDGFSNSPVLGVNISYSNRVVSQGKWSGLLGLLYRRQKPLEIVNIQLLNLTNSIEFEIAERFSVGSTLGYGVAVERSASDRQFSQFNSLSGLFLVQCVYRL